MANKEYLRMMREGVEKELPSGLVVHLRPIDSSVLLGSKKIPNNLMYIVHKQILGIGEGKDAEEVAKEVATEIQEEEKHKDAQRRAESTLTWYIETLEYGKLVALESVIEPKIVEHAVNDGEMELSWFRDIDLQVFGQWVGVPLKDLEQFRFRSSANVEPVQPEQSNLPSTEQGDGTAPVVEEQDATNVGGSGLVG